MSGTSFGDGGGGSGLSASRYIHEQLIAEEVWLVQHDLGCYPSVTVVDSANRVIEADVEYLDMNSLTITFGSANGGNAYIN